MAQIIPNSSAARLSRQLAQPTSRQFGTTLRSNGGLLTRRTPDTKIRSSAMAAPNRLASIGQARYNSTQANSAPAAAPAATSPTTPDTASTATITMPAPSDPALSDISGIELSGSDLLNMPENIGFLHNMGLDFGWGPTSLMQWLLEHTYVYTGLPWWASIGLTAVLVRLAMLPLSVRAEVTSQKLRDLRNNPQYEAAFERYKDAARGTFDKMALMVARQEMKNMEQAEGLKSKWFAVIGPLLPIFPAIGMFRLCRAMADLPVPSWETGGLLWFSDLTVADPFFILPVVGGALLYLGTRTAQQHMTGQQKTMMTLMSKLMLPLGTILTAWLPAGLTFYFCCASVMAWLQTIVFTTPSLRRLVGLPPLKSLSSTAGGNASYQAPREESLMSTIKKGYTDKSSEHIARARQKKVDRYEEKRALQEKEEFYSRLKSKDRRGRKNAKAE